MNLGPKEAPSAEQALALREWLADDLELAFGGVLSNATRAVSAVYHLTDKLWAIPQSKRSQESRVRVPWRWSTTRTR